MEFGRKILVSNRPVDEITQTLKNAFEAVGVLMQQSFDLQSACAPLQSPCPHHGTVPCNCQLVVLTLRSKDDVWGALAIHGSEGQCEISIIEEEHGSNILIDDLIAQAIEPSADVYSR